MISFGIVKQVPIPMPLAISFFFSMYIVYCYQFTLYGITPATNKFIDQEKIIYNQFGTKISTWLILRSGSITPIDASLTYLIIGKKKTAFITVHVTKERPGEWVFEIKE